MTEQIQALLRQLTPMQRLWIAGATGISVVALVAFVLLAGQPDMQPAFTRLSTTEAATISDALRTAKIQFQVADAGATILVPSSRLADARVAAGAAGAVTDGTTGFELFDKSNFGMSEFDQQVTYQRATQGELERTIEAMAGVSSARVAIVPAQQGLFSDQDRAATASVMLEMRNGVEPSAAMVRGITTTVAGAVAGLISDNVTVVDQQGRVLSGSQDATTVGALAAQQAVERNTEVQVQGLLDRAIGPGTSSVTVAATMDFDKVEQEITTYTPVTTGAYTPVSVHRITENYGAGASPGTGGIPGSQSNVPGLPTYPGSGLPTASAAPSAAPGASPAPSGSPNASASPAATATVAPGGYARNEETVNYNLSQTVQHIVQEPGMVKRLSVAVLVDEKAAGDISAETLTKSISAAIGADTTRGDVVSVTAIPFATPAEAVPASSDMVETILGYVRNVAGVLVGLLLLFLVWRNVRALRRRSEDLSLAVVGGQAAFPAYDATGAPAQIAAGADTMPDQAQHTQIQERLRTVADQRPDALVNLMNSWLVEDGKRR